MTEISEVTFSGLLGPSGPLRQHPLSDHEACLLSETLVGRYDVLHISVSQLPSTKRALTKSRMNEWKEGKGREGTLVSQSPCPYYGPVLLKLCDSVTVLARAGTCSRFSLSYTHAHIPIPSFLITVFTEHPLGTSPPQY